MFDSTISFNRFNKFNPSYDFILKSSLKLWSLVVSNNHCPLGTLLFYQSVDEQFRICVNFVLQIQRWRIGHTLTIEQKFILYFIVTFIWLYSISLEFSVSSSLMSLLYHRFTKLALVLIGLMSTFLQSASLCFFIFNNVVINN